MSNFDEADTWFVSCDGVYGGSFPFKENFAVIIAGDNDAIRTAVLGALLKTALPAGFPIASARPKGSPALVEREYMVSENMAAEDVIYQMLRVRPEVLVLDTLFPFKDSTFSGHFYPQLTGHSIFYVVPASGDTAEELRLSAIESYLALTKNEGLEHIDCVMVAGASDLDSEEAFTVTEFLVKD